MANAVYHKSYELNKPIEVQIWPDKIEILSFPGPVPPITAKILAENKRIVARDYRNRRVGDFLKERHLIEGRGTGIPTIYSIMKNNGSPLPVIETDEHCTYFLTVLPVNTAFADQPEDASAQDSAQDNAQVNDRNIAVLEYCFKPRSREEILAMLNLTNHRKNYQRHVEPLFNEGLLVRTIPDKPTSKLQRYRTTRKGKNIINNIANNNSGIN